ncbi:type IA DNA topoisomerase [Granulicella tundricola]|uniref:DNA topoisomerase n=1 Tax=Granulicella tundricola (strain ATCC BAA-1859 / DSM 23138 / MP5ACTX9) TaxID=1198114 RepID=E8X469_GRATM|nr:type IA DNA topoisomerase [Granulicella tundricola]ADW67129.1 DNA topoisomerase III [Granulicella tundricola MP5ACTX9]
MRVFLAEKPSVAREIAQALGCTHKEQGFFRGKNDLVTWAIGHLVRFAEPGEMNPAWGKPWRREALPMLPKDGGWLLIPEPRTEDQFNVVARLFGDKRITQIVNATDAGREGEAIFRRIYALSGASKPVLRFWTSSLTEEAIASALSHLRPAADYDNLASAALTRAQLDWLIGMNHSRAATLHNSVTCSVGRVQTPTLAMIVRRHHEIAGFIKTFFYEVHADLGEFVARAVNSQQKHDFEIKAEAETILRDVPSDTLATVTLVEVKKNRKAPPQLHNLGELQKEANRRFGFPADRTLAIAQSLYESKAITYPRSSSRHLSEDMVDGLPAVLKALRLGEERASYVKQALHRAQHGPALSKRFVDGSKLSDHHAIIPTAKPAPASLSGDERKVYTIVAERFLAIFLPDKETEDTRIDLEIAKHPFRARGSRLIAPGWTVLTGNQDFENKAADAEDRQALPAVKKGDELEVVESELVTKERKPPSRYTDATLLAAMETAGREIDDDELREAMKGRGLGTEATRAAIIQRLLDLAYVIRDGKQFEPTGKGIALIAQVLPHLASPELTGDMEAKLNLVEAGQLDAAEILAEVSESLRHEIPAVFRSKPMQAPDAPRITAGKDELLCPKCKAGLVTKRSTPNASAPFYGCARFHDGCNFTINTVVAKKTLTETNIKDLCSPTRHHTTKIIKGFTSKAGKKFDAFLQLSSATDFKTEFVFPR